MSKIVIKMPQNADKRVWFRIAHNMDYPLDKVGELVLSHVALAPRQQLPDGSVEYSTPLWRPIYLDRYLIGKENLHTIKPGHYLGTITYKIFDPNATIQMFENGDSVHYYISVPKGGTLVPDHIIFSDLRPVSVPQVESLTLWESIAADIDYCYSSLKKLIQL